MGLGEILADRRHQMHPGEEARRVGEVGGGAAKSLLHLPEGGLDAVQRDRADDQEPTHCSGDREAGLDRGWPAAGARRLRSRGRWCRPRERLFRPRGK